MSKSNSAQVNMLKKMREEHANKSTLEKLIEQEKENKGKSSTSKQENHITIPSSLITISTSECKPWDFADRSSSEMGDIEELANSIKTNGQQEPALIRPLAEPDGNVKYEVIFGHRRWLACKICNQPLLAILKNISDSEAAIAQKEENENRENLSDYARAINYQKLIASGVFSNESVLSANLNIKRSTLGDIMSFNKIHPDVMACIKEPHKLNRRMAVKLAQICKDSSKEEIQKLCDILPMVIDGTLPLSVLNKIKSKEQIQPSKQREPHRKVFINEMSVKLFNSGVNQNNAPCFTFHKIVTDNNLLKDLEDLVLTFLKEKTEKN